MKSKFLKSLMLTGSLSLLLAACGNDTAEEPATDDAATEEAATEDTAAAGDAVEGRADGHNGEIVVNVTFDGDTITAIDVVEHQETEGIADDVFTTYKDQIVETNSTNVDAVTDATVSSEALSAAVEDAASTAGVTLQ